MTSKKTHSKLGDAAALAAKAAEATAAAELAQHEALEAKAAFDLGAEVRRQAFMRNWLAEEFVQAPEADVALRASKAAFEEAVQADPLMQVWLAYVRSSYRTGMDGQTAANFAQQTGVHAPVYYPNPSTPTFFDVMQRAMEHLASRLEGERQAEIMDALERAAEGDV